MITYDELYKQIHKITEVSNVFLYLIEERSMCDTQITCDLFFDYVEKVKNHLEIQDNHLYSSILKDGDDKSKKIAENFMSGSIEIKRIFQKYLKKWSHPGKHKLLISNYDKFNDETKEIFEMVLNRIQDETEHLYPLIRSISGNMKKVA
ncbi:MAG: hypothetical protein HOM14_15845 [Gammaproteobacteria bacterium]|jgi:hypothetical protein|nr:hypothetical protein [Gammaproteobacteria bacterium]MBT3725829.1 hypothetical protein [Gammaproteobacteria bacterium]MBT4195708.1 hypothetical protein [Gammaproteobacteria bacterium]MBT4450785.1 hypothetical protein [Gammaproteobacteria bacterium]MBT4860489.1 hypothetical protein [Gammaproteobacteria bacterium]